MLWVLKNELQVGMACTNTEGKKHFDLFENGEWTSLSGPGPA